MPGLARRVRGSGDDTIWTLTLRRGVRFQDGEPFNADVVVANAERWQSTPEGQALLPDVVDVFAPRFDEVRFLLAAPDPRVRPPAGIAPAGDRLAARARDAPTVPARRSGRSTRARARSRCGSGARCASSWPATRTGGARRATWTLARLSSRSSSGRSPAPPCASRCSMSGDAQVADELVATQAQQARADPLLYALPGAEGTWLGLSRSVRGIDSAREIPSLSSAWLTNVTVAD